MGFVLLFALQNEVAVFPRVEVPQRGKSLLHLFEEVQNRVAVIGQFHLGVKVYIDVEFICIRYIAIHPDDPEYGDINSSPAHAAPLQGRPPRTERVKFARVMAYAILTQGDSARNEWAIGLTTIGGR